MTVTECIDYARRDFIREFSPEFEPFAIVLSDGQWAELKQARLAHARVTTDDYKGAPVRKYAGLIVMVFRYGAGAMVGPGVVGEGVFQGLLDGEIAGLA